METTVICIRKENLKKLGYRDLEHWLENPNNVYIGRNMSFYVKGANKSKWANKFTVKKYGRDGCLKEYKKFILNSPLIDDIEELRGKTLGCWCSPEPCHGDVLIEILNSLN